MALPHSFDFETIDEMIEVMRKFEKNKILDNDKLQNEYEQKQILQEVLNLDKEIRKRKLQYLNPRHPHVQILTNKRQQLKARWYEINEKKEFDEYFSTTCRKFSMVLLFIGQNSSLESSVLLLPEEIKKKRYFRSSEGAWSTDSPMGKFLLNKNVGFEGSFVNSQNRVVNISIISSIACPLDILIAYEKSLNNSPSNFYLNGVYSLHERSWQIHNPK